MSGPAEPLQAIRRPAAASVVALVALAAVYGASFVAIKVAVRQLGPATIAAGRIAIGALLLGVYCRLRGDRWTLLERGHLYRLPLVGVLGIALPFSLLNWAETRLSGGVTATIFACGPLIAAVLSHLLTRDDRIDLRKAAGLVLGLSGVLLAFGGARGALGGGAYGAKLAIVATVTCYATSGLVVRRVRGLNGVEISAAALGWAALFCVAAALALERPWSADLDPKSIGAVAYLAVLPTAGGYALRFSLIRAHGYIFVSFIGYMVPLFGVLWSALLLGERIPLSALAALVLILAGIVLARSSRGGHRTSRADSPTEQ